MSNRESWNLVNISDRVISSGFSYVKAIGPGKSTDLLATISKDEVRQSRGISKLLDRAWARIDKVIDGTVVATITADNIGELFSDVSLDINADGNIDLQGHDLNMNIGEGVGGGGVNLEGGSINFNNEVSMNATGTVVSVNCSELVAAADLTAFGRLTAVGEVNLALPPEEPMIEVSAFTLYQNGDKLILKARGLNGKVVRVELADFVTDGTDE